MRWFLPATAAAFAAVYLARRGSTPSSSKPSSSSSSSSGSSSSADIAQRFGIPASLARSIVDVSARVGIADPVWLARLIRFESRFNPQAVNPRSGATGLIQFMPSTAQELGTTTQAIGSLSALAQMSLVERYFKLPRIASKGPFRTEADTFMAVFYPAAIGQGPSYTFNDAVQRANPGIRTAGDYVALATRGSP